MLKAVILFYIFFFSFVAEAQLKKAIHNINKLTPKTTTIVHRLGDSYVRLKMFQYGEKKDIVFINLHDNENTSAVAVKRSLETRGGLLIKIDNNSKRNIQFRLDGRSYTIDPNRIFSKNGIQHTLIHFGRISNKAMDEVNKLAERILQLLPKELSCVIALHNNSDGNFSINYYLPGNEKEKDAKLIHRVTGQDPDDFFLTTDSLLFRQLAKKNYNTVWQNNIQVSQDGSLSVYCGEKNIVYLNCETEHGKLKQYEEMIRVSIREIEMQKD